MPSRDTQTDEKMRIMKQQKENKHYTIYDWLQLLSNLAIPLVIGVFAITMSYSQMNQTQIQYETDMQIAADNRRNDNEMLDDQQKEEILISYESFLADIFRSDGRQLDKNEASPFIVRFKTLAALRQLDSARKALLIQLLYDGELIVNNKSQMKTAIVSLKSADLRNLHLGMDTIPISSSASDMPPEPLVYRVKPQFNNVDLSDADLTNSSFRSMDITGCLFEGAQMDRVNLSYSVAQKSTSFRRASMKYAIIKEAEYSLAMFSRVILNEAIIDSFICNDCNFGFSFLIKVKMINSHFVCSDNYQYSCGFHRANLSGSILEASEFYGVTFGVADWYGIKLAKSVFVGASFDRNNMSKSIISDTRLISCEFLLTNFRYAMVNGSSFVGSSFLNADLSNSQFIQSDFEEAELKQTDLTNTILQDSNFYKASFVGCHLLNTSFIGSNLSYANLTDGIISDQQLRQAKTIQGAILPNRTIFI